MKTTHWVVTAVMLLAVAPWASAVPTFDLYLYGTSTSSTVLDLTRENTLDLWLQMTTDVAEPVVGVRYEVVNPYSGWELTSRDMATFGWAEADGGFFDLSVPDASNVPAIVNNALYPVTPGVPDFYTDTIRADFTGVTGTTTVERFTLTIPKGQPVGPALIYPNNPGAYDDLGTEYTAFLENGFEVEFQVLPEPGSIVLFSTGILGILGLGLRRRRALAAVEQETPSS